MEKEAISEKSPFSLGVGYLNWSKGERQTDRYGTVKLFDESPSSGEATSMKLLSAPIGSYGQLIAEVIERGNSAFTDRTVKVGDKLTLGEGILFLDVDDWGGENIGLKPLKDKDINWLNPKVLHKVHRSKVRLFFEEKPFPRKESKSK